MSSKRQSSVEWLAEQLRPAVALQGKIIDEYLEQAKQLHEQEIEKTWQDAVVYQSKVCDAIIWMDDYTPKTGEQYYKETYGE